MDTHSLSPKNKKELEKTSKTKTGASRYVVLFDESTLPETASLKRCEKRSFTNTRHGVRAAAVRARAAYESGDDAKGLVLARFALGSLDVPGMENALLSVPASSRASACCRAGMRLDDERIFEGCAAEVLCALLMRNTRWEIPRDAILDALIRAENCGGHLARVAVYGFVPEKTREKAIEALLDMRHFVFAGECVASAPVSNVFRERATDRLLEEDDEGRGVLASVAGTGLRGRMEKCLEKLSAKVLENPGLAGEFGRRFTSKNVLSVLEKEELSKVLGVLSKCGDANLFDWGSVDGVPADAERIRAICASRANFFHRLAFDAVSGDETALHSMRAFFMSPSGRKLLSRPLSKAEKEDRKTVAEVLSKMWKDALHGNERADEDIWGGGSACPAF